MMSATNRETSTERLQRMLAVDVDLLTHRLDSCLVGVDEVGRGSLIGPVVSAAARWKQGVSPSAYGDLVGVNDSKKLSAAKRQALLPAIHRCFDVAIGEASIEDIAEHNIIGASLLSSARAVRALCSLSETDSLPNEVHLLMDGRDVMPAFDVTQQTAIIKGDGHSVLIAVASIVAKEHRDAWVLSVAGEYPEYGWSTNMGYATATHREAIAQWGKTFYHRTSFM
jgi:ribonuclease HII